MPAMDAVAGLLDGPRARGAFLLRSTLDPPWSLRIQDEAPLTLVAVVRGHAWIVPDGADAVVPGHGRIVPDGADAVMHGQVRIVPDRADAVVPASRAEQAPAPSAARLA